MFDIGWSELLLIGVVALLVVGPKDLPDMLRTMGRFTAKARSMAREFSRAMEDAARESGVSEVTKDLRAMTSKKSLGLDALEGAASKFESWDPMKASAARKAASSGAPSMTKVADAASGAAAAHGPATAALVAEKAKKAAARKASAAERAADAEMAAEYAEADEPAAKPRKAPVRKSAPVSPDAAKPAALVPTPRAKPAVKRATPRKPAAKAD